MNRLCLAALIVAAAAAAACPSPDDVGFEVALVTPGPVTDAGWNAAAFAGLDAIGERLAATTAHAEASSPAEFEEAFRAFAARGAELVFGHGFEFQDAALTVAAEYPQSAFAVTSGLAVSDNVAGVVFRLEEAAYLAGVLAAGVSDSGVTGMVGGMEIPPVRLVFDGYRRGFLDARPDGVVKEVYIGGWEDAAAGRQAALSLIGQGADVVLQDADAAGLGVFQACRERGVWAIGSNADQSDAAPGVVLASATMDIPEAMVRVAEDVAGGSFQGGLYVFDLASGLVELVMNPALAENVPSEVRDALTEAHSAVVDGTVDLAHFGE